MRLEFQKVLNWFIPEHLPDTPEVRRKALFTVSFLLVAWGHCVFYIFFHTFTGYQEGIYFTWYSIFLSSACILFFRQTGKFIGTAWFFMIGCLTIIWGIANWAGGAYSFVSAYYGLSIIAAFWIGNNRLGIQWSIFIITWIVILLPALEKIFGAPLNTYPEAYKGIFTIIINTGILASFAVMIYIYEIGRKRLEDKLGNSQRQLIEAEKMASLGQLTAGIAHEINNPTNFIKGSSEALKADVQDIISLLEKVSQLKKSENKIQLFQEIEDSYREIDGDFLLQEILDLIKGIQKGGERIHNIVKGLQRFAHESEEEIADVNLEEGLDSTLIVLNSKIEDKTIEVIKNYGKLPFIHCHAGKINQVFLNVINNAIQAMGIGGQLRIDTFQDRGMIKIQIHDNGKGIDADTKKNIFNPFFTTKEVGKGTGLGLFISYGIIEDHNGTIEVESELGKGSTFTISLPLTG